MGSDGGFALFKSGYFSAILMNLLQFFVRHFTLFSSFEFKYFSPS